MERAALIIAITVMAQPANSEDDWLAALCGAGFGESEARRAIAFIPIGLGRPILEKLGVTSFTDLASIRLSSGDWMEIRLSDQPEYSAALLAARDHYATGSLPHEAFRAVALRSSEVVAVSNGLDAGVDVAGATVATAFHDPKLARHIKV